MAKADRILSFFPWYYRATDRTKLLAEVVRQLAQPLEEADTHLFRIQRAHRIKVAEHAEDVIQLAAALNLTAFHFEDLLADESLDYGQKLALMRERVQRIARVHLDGLGTAWAILESAAIFLNAVIVPEQPRDALIKHVDAKWFSHKAVVEFSHLPDKPRERIYLHENPFRRKKVEPAERWPLNSWAVENKTVEAAPVKLAIQGIDDRTILPSIFCPATQEGIMFNGVIPAGKTLVIDDANGAVLDDQPVDEWLIYFQGGIFDFSNGNGASFIHEQAELSTPFDGDMEKIVSQPFQKKRPALTVPMGRSAWHFKVAEGVYDGNDYDFAVYATDPTPIGLYDGDFNFEACVFDYPASGVVGMAWDERIPCSFKLVLPARIPQPQSQATNGSTAPDKIAGQPVNYVGRIGSILPRFKAAGVRAFVDTAKDAWILGESVMRVSSAAQGEGVEFHVTRMQNQKTDILVSLDTTSS